MGNQCRDDSCLMKFSTERHRNAHEVLMHKTLIDDVAVRMVNRIISTNSESNVTKKVIVTDKGTFSYREAANLLSQDDSSEKKAVLTAMKSVVELLFNDNPEWTARELLTVPDFKVD